MILFFGEHPFVTLFAAGVVFIAGIFYLSLPRKQKAPLTLDHRAHRLLYLMAKGDLDALEWHPQTAAEDEEPVMCIQARAAGWVYEIQGDGMSRGAVSREVVGLFQDLHLEDQIALCRQVSLLKEESGDPALSNFEVRIREDDIVRGRFSGSVVLVPEFSEVLSDITA